MEQSPDYGGASGMPQPGMKMPDNQLLGEFTSELDRMENIRGSFDVRLQSVMESIGPEESSQAMPEEAPYHDLHSLIIRLRRENSAYESILRRIRL